MLYFVIEVGTLITGSVLTLQVARRTSTCVEAATRAVSPAVLCVMDSPTAMTNQTSRAVSAVSSVFYKGVAYSVSFQI